jgi:predicted Zn-dependent protease
VRYTAALALAVAGDLQNALVRTAELGRQGPEDTFVQNNYLPTLRGQIALSEKDAVKAIEALQAVKAHELSANIDPLKLIYVRGQAYLAMHHGDEAVVEFQKIVEHRGLVFTSIIGALARLQMGRAYVMLGDTVKARSAYQDFLTLWKEADSDGRIFVSGH